MELRIYEKKIFFVFLFFYCYFVFGISCMFILKVCERKEKRISCMFILKVSERKEKRISCMFILKVYERKEKDIAL